MQGFSYEGHRDARLHRVQAAQLQHDQEQEEDDGTIGVLEVLPLLSKTYAAQGVEVKASW